MMTWHLNNVPKTFFGFWGTQEFPFIRWLCLKTFREHHPDWEMILYDMPILQNYGNDFQGISYWDRLEELDIEVVTMDVETRMGMKYPLPYITVISDTMRYIALGDHGGFYVDLDNLFFRSLESMPWNTPENSDKNGFLLTPPYHHFLGGKEGLPYYTRVLDMQKSILSGDPNRILDTTGCTMRVPRTKDEKIMMLPLITTEENFNSDGPKSEYAIALNWHGSGSYGKYQAVTEENYNTSDHPLAAAVRYCLDGDMGKPSGINDVVWIQRGE